MMNRPLALACVSIFAVATVAVTAAAQPAEAIRFSLASETDNPGKIHATFRTARDGRHDNNWSTGFMPSELQGLEVSSFRGPGTRPIHFAIVREAGRLDCAGNGGGSRAEGNCRFTRDAAFTQLLASRRVGRADDEQAFALMAVNARREFIDALARAQYPTPTIDDLVALAALRVDGDYIDGMSHAGYRPPSLHSLVEFKALDISPEWIAGFARVGYANLPGDGLVQLKALRVTPDFIAGFQQLGYRDLPVRELVELKALNITPDFVRENVGERAPMPGISELVDLKLFGKHRR